MSIYKKLREATKKIASGKPKPKPEEGPPPREIPSDEETDAYIKKYPDVVPKAKK